MGIGEDHPIGAGDEARTQALLLLDRGTLAKQAADRIDHPGGGIDAHHRRAHLGNRIDDHIAAGPQGGAERRIGNSGFRGLLPAWQAGQAPIAAGQQHGQHSDCAGRATQGTGGHRHCMAWGSVHLL